MMEYITKSEEERIKEMSVFEVLPPDEYRTGEPISHNPKGCFEKSFQYMDNIQLEGGMLVHGMYFPWGVPENKFSYVDHAWVELPGDIVFDGVLQRFYRKMDYYKYYNAIKVYEYAYDEAIKKALDDNTYGPWEFGLFFEE